MAPIRLVSRAAFVAALSFPVVLVAQAPADSTAMSLVKQARGQVQRGQLDSALATFGAAATSAPALSEPHAGIGAVLDLQGNYGEARNHLQRALQLATPAQKDGAWRALAISYAFERKTKEIVANGMPAYEARIAAKDFSGAAEVSNEIARLLIESGDLSAAEQWYRQGHDAALRTPALPDSARDLWDFRWEHALGRLAARRGNKAEADRHVAAASAILDRGRIPEQKRFFPYLVGYVAFYLKDYPTALAELQKAEQRDPFILALEAQAHEALGHMDMAMPLWKQVMTFTMHNPTNAYARPLAAKKVS